MSLALRLSFAAAFLSAAASLPAHAEKLNVKLGLWETTSTTQMKGMQMPQIPPDALAQIPPEQRKAMEAMMSGAPQTETLKHCITQEDLDQPFELGEFQDSGCRQSKVTETATLQEVQYSCSGENDGTGTLRIEAPSPETVKGTMKMTTSHDGQTVDMSSSFTGRYIGEDCAGAER